MLYFDLGYKKQQGSDGYILFAPDRLCLGGQGRWYGNKTPTVNVAEARASVEAIEYWKALKFHPCPLLLRGDSQITINFLTRHYNPGKCKLVVAVDKHHKWGYE